ncbi:MAG: TIGR04282 family arsenosugar biosynthesis glycosyltransferase [Pyrinomonadaceae bacterium]|nr:TIGR04282 family arsenosugar biosynthesis glycosyltransferase [Pyrinomonadaceae bacterium]
MTGTTNFMDFVTQNFRPAIIVMVKAPRAGTVKTRLNTFLSSEQSAELAICFLRDTVTKISQPDKNIILAYAPPEGREMLENLLPQNLIWFNQIGDDLGQRLDSAINFAANSKFSPIIVIGADSPTFPVEYVQTAIKQIVNDETDVVLAPTTDGGFYLIGMSKPLANIFDEVVWSTETVYKKVLENIQNSGLRFSTLPEWYDIDTPPDLLILRKHFSDEQELQRVAPQTFRWFQSNEHLFE